MQDKSLWKKQYTMFDLEELSDDIWYFKNSVSCPEKIIEIIEDLNLNSLSYKRIPPWEIWNASNDENSQYGFVKSIVKDFLQNDCNDDEINKKTLYVINSLIMAIELSCGQYFEKHKINLNSVKTDISILPIRKWMTNKKMGPHFDGMDGDSTLAFTSILYLNDSYEGGEIHFQNHDITVKPEAGSVLIFPAQKPFFHEVFEIKNGIRYAMPIVTRWT